MPGLVFSTLGRRPERDDTVTVGSVRLTVARMADVRISRVRVHLAWPGPAREGQAVTRGIVAESVLSVGRSPQRACRASPLARCGVWVMLEL